MTDFHGYLVLVGTKAQFIKMAPVILEMQARNLDFRLIYTGQHSETFDLLERAFGTPLPDDIMVSHGEASTKRSFARWSVAFWGAAWARVRSGQWRGARCGLVHGDTASTLLTAMALRMAGVPVAHVEAGLRSPKLLDPFPEEIVRRLVSAMSRYHFAPDAQAVDNLRRARGKVIETGGNTLRDALRAALKTAGQVPAMGGGGGYAIASIHRSENLASRRDFQLILEEIIEASRKLPIRFVLHPVTREKLDSTGWGTKLLACPGIRLQERMSYPDFVALLLAARMLITDGGSNQEEAAMLGLPTLLMRRATERQDGLGGNIVLSGLERDVIRAFVDRYRQADWTIAEVRGSSPSARIVDELERLP